MSGRVRVSATIDPDIAAWVDERVEAKEFADRSHAIEHALNQLRIERMGQLATWPAAELRLMANPSGRLSGWDEMPQTSHFFGYTWHKSFGGGVTVFLSTDESRTRIKIEIEDTKGAIGSGRFSILAQQWFGPYPSGLSMNGVWTLEEFAKRLEEYVETHVVSTKPEENEQDESLSEYKKIKTELYYE